MARADHQRHSGDISYQWMFMHTHRAFSQGMPIQFLISATLVGYALTSFCV